MPRFSVIVPVYNRPDEIKELLESLVHQSYKNFEVIVVEDGSKKRCEEIVKSFARFFPVQYYYKENTGQGYSRNFGFERAKGDYFVVFDSDCLIPPHYFLEVEKHINARGLDAWGGPDRAHTSFSPVQKAISYSMTSFFTTGGIRGNKRHIGSFHPRSFNMGISRDVWIKTGGYIITRMGEDIEFSIRIIDNQFKTGLIEDAYVYHKRRTSFGQFFKQLHFFGRARINIQRFYPKELKLIHTFPALFTIACLLLPVLYFMALPLYYLVLTGLLLYLSLVFFDASMTNKSLYVGFLSLIAVCVQLFGYGIGFISEGARGKKVPASSRPPVKA
jgi:glycosyltransferase involved in cell wall biosynthesis